MEFLNRDQLIETLCGIFEEVIESYGADEYEWMCEEYAHLNADIILGDMAKYVHLKDTSMCGNFANIREDWDLIPTFVKSEVQPWGRFDDVVASIDNGTISDEDLAKFQTWALDWFFTAFGTWRLKYNFGVSVSEMMYEDEREMEREMEMESEE